MKDVVESSALSKGAIGHLWLGISGSAGANIFTVPAIDGNSAQRALRDKPLWNQDNSRGMVTLAHLSERTAVFGP
jgi:hypothetical protein